MEAREAPGSDDECQLPPDTMAILQEFLKEQKTKDLEEDWVIWRLISLKIY